MSELDREIHKAILRVGSFTTDEQQDINIAELKALIATQIQEARIEELELARLWCAGGQGCEYSKLKDRLAQLRSTPNEDMDN